MNPYLITSVLFLFLASLAALDSGLTSFQILPWFNSLRWLRVHLITLGALTEAVFGVLPALAARHAGLARGAGYAGTPLHWNIWLALTLGLLVLLVGIPLVNYPLIVTGGALVFIAVLGLMAVLRRLAPAPGQPGQPTGAGRAFYLAGLSFQLLGIIVGSGLWFGWGKALRIANPLEVHIHTNIWGFMSLVLAGLAVDLYPRWTGRPLAWPASIRPIFWTMTLGALGSVLGPWLGATWLIGLGILVHQAATIGLLANLIRPLPGTTAVHEPGIWHVLTAYVWQTLIVLATPLVVLLMPGFSPTGVEQTAPQVLIYGWMLQFGYALVPYLLRRATAPHQEARLGGSWLSLVSAHAGGVFLAASLLIPTLSRPLLGVTYLLWFVSLLPIARQSWRILSTGLPTPQQDEALAAPAAPKPD